MFKLSKFSPVLRAVGVMSVVAALVTGVTFALSTQATLTGNTFSSATAGLLVDGSDADTTPTVSEAGYSFTDIIPGADYTAPKAFILNNSGTAALDVKVQATGGTSTGAIDTNKVHVKFTNTSTGNTMAEYTLADLAAGVQNVPGASGLTNALIAGESNTINIQVKMDADAITSSSASIDNFNFVFTGTAETAPVTT